MARTSRIAAARISGAGWIRIRSNSAYFEDTISRVSNSVLYITNKWVSDHPPRGRSPPIFPCGKASRCDFATPLVLRAGWSWSQVLQERGGNSNIAGLAECVLKDLKGGIMRVSKVVTVGFPVKLAESLRQTVPSISLSAYVVCAVSRRLELDNSLSQEGGIPDTAQVPESFRRGLVNGMVAGAERRPDHLCADDAEEPYGELPAWPGEEEEYALSVRAELGSQRCAFIPPLRVQCLVVPGRDMGPDLSGGGTSEGAIKLISFRLPAEWVTNFQDHVPDGRRSRFVAEAVESGLRAAGLEDEKIDATEDTIHAYCRGSAVGYRYGLSLRPTETLKPDHTEDLVYRMLCAVARKVDGGRSSTM